MFCRWKIDPSHADVTEAASIELLVESKAEAFQGDVRVSWIPWGFPCGFHTEKMVKNHGGFHPDVFRGHHPGGFIVWFDQPLVNGWKGIGRLWSGWCPRYIIIICIYKSSSSSSSFSFSSYLCQGVDYISIVRRVYQLMTGGIILPSQYTTSMMVGWEYQSPSNMTMAQTKIADGDLLGLLQAFRDT